MNGLWQDMSLCLSVRASLCRADIPLSTSRCRLYFRMVQIPKVTDPREFILSSVAELATPIDTARYEEHGRCLACGLLMLREWPGSTT